VRIQQSVEREHRTGGLPTPLGVRIGLAAGDVRLEGGDCFGIPVVEAARLCELAGGGEILASEVVRLLSGPGEEHDFRRLGNREQACPPPSRSGR
jgi:class 3 adenylate cyclase